MLLQFLLEKLLFFLSFPSFPSQTQPGCFYSRAWTPEPWAGISPGSLGWALGNFPCPDPPEHSQERLHGQGSRIKWFLCFNSIFLNVLGNSWAGVEPFSTPEVYSACYFSAFLLPQMRLFDLQFKTCLGRKITVYKWKILLLLLWGSL